MILWILLIIIVLSLFSWWLKNFQKKLKSLETKKSQEELNLPSFWEGFETLPEIEMPKIEMPEFSEEELKELEEMMEEQ